MQIGDYVTLDDIMGFIRYFTLVLYDDALTDKEKLLEISKICNGLMDAICDQLLDENRD